MLIHFLRVLTAVVCLTLGVRPVSAAPADDGSLHQLAKRVGPSGKLVHPVEGQVFEHFAKHPDLHLNLIYQTVRQYPNGNCGYYICSNQTYYISAALTGNGQNIKMADFLVPSFYGDDINVWLGAPASVCGKYRVEIYETQNLMGKQITFKSAAPLITINCPRVPTGEDGPA